MCTIIAAIGLSTQWPVLLASVRDEALERPWLPPAAHWPGQHPHLVGGLDLQSGGTWLAFDPQRHRASFLVNRQERAAGTPRSRGELPLMALQHPERTWEAGNLRAYSGFILGQADAHGLVLHQWDTRTLQSVRLGKGVHGLCYRGIGEPHPRLTRHLPRFSAAPLPRPQAGDTPAQAWGLWLQLLAGDGQYHQQSDALLWRREVDGRPWASQSAACLALADGRSRLDFSSAPLDPTSWQPLPTPLLA